MLLDDLVAVRARTLALFDDPQWPAPAQLDAVVDAALDRRDALLALAAQHPTPFYAFDRAALRQALQRFRSTFDAALPRHESFYAIKSNHHPWAIDTAAAAGFGLDVSSGRELQWALARPDVPIVFSGPAKSDADLALALDHAPRVTVQLDSFRELERLGALTSARDVRVRAGVRVHTRQHGAWSKFGIALSDLPRFWQAASAWPGVELCGIQSHLSWNRNAEPYERVLADLGACLRVAFTASQRGQLRFVDIGGGFRPHQLEGGVPTDHPLAAIAQAANDHAGVATHFAHDSIAKPSVPLETYAEAIGRAFAEHILPLADVAGWTEPGRIVSTFALHLVVRVVDRKSAGLVIVDGGTHMVGWEKYLHIHAPVINLTRPSRAAIPVVLGGALCDCEDVLGRHCYASATEEGDVLVMPWQGAYTWATAQAFIRDVPDVVELV
ncbi:MAG: decarboxylase [Myxococcales bacterium]|nr:decarboxylase [Myxococcales bacterium]